MTVARVRCTSKSFLKVIRAGGDVAAEEVSMDASAFLSGALLGLIAGGGGIFAYIQASGKSAVARARAEAANLITNATKEAQNKAKEIELSAKQEQLKLKETFEKENDRERKKLEELEARLTERR